jgi:hypothetical protein
MSYNIESSINISGIHVDAPVDVENILIESEVVSSTNTISAPLSITGVAIDATIHSNQIVIDAPISLARGEKGEKGDAGDANFVSGWVSLVQSWSEVPTLNTELVSGDVYNYEYGSTTYYRFVPDPYFSSGDIFYSSFSGVELSNLIAVRAKML